MSFKEMTAYQRVKYIWRIIGKLFSFFVFGLGCIFIVTFIFPTLFLLTLGSRKSFKKWGRIAVTKSFALFVWFMQKIRGITFDVKGKEKLVGLRSKVIVANHPSLLDVVMLISIIPNADCLVKASLGKRNLMRGVVNRLYIPNSEDFNDILRESAESMAHGNCFIIFPEGTRTRPGKPFQFKKGAARIALNAKRDIVPIYFGGNEKIGLRKYDRMLSFNPTARYHYNLEVLDTIRISAYENLSQTKTATVLTEDMRKLFEDRKRRDL
ncbi:MAG: 1-acyl-sn-glycerol-3-phosphate acyltransferase [Fibrobacteraceae bacterium]|nr:1-acyl-sn-glycerol-3-phosphate acyltransferase [Fibrobacteraceae bacterium]